MPKSAKIIFSLLVILTIALLFDTQPKTNSETIKIGAVYDLTGVWADGGKAFLEGTEIAKEEINSKGGINGRLLEVIYEDGKDLSAKPTVDGAQKLININNVKALLTVSYSAIAGLQLLAEQNQVPILETIDASQDIGKLGEWIFGTGIYTEGQGAMVADFAKDSLKINKIGILVGKDSYLLAVSNAFENKFVKLGGQITAREEFIVGETNFRTQLIKIKNSGTEAIFFAHLGEGGVGIKQAREIGFDGYFLGTDTMSIADVIKTAGEQALNNKTFFALWRNFDALTPEQTEFANRFKEKYNKEAGDYLFYNVLGYDGLMVLAEAMKNSDLTGEDIKNSLYKIQNFQGLSGSITLDATGINHDPKSAMVMYKNGKIIRYSK